MLYYLFSLGQTGALHITYAGHRSTTDINNYTDCQFKVNLKITISCEGESTHRWNMQLLHKEVPTNLEVSEVTTWPLCHFMIHFHWCASTTKEYHHYQSQSNKPKMYALVSHYCAHELFPQAENRIKTTDAKHVLYI